MVWLRTMQVIAASPIAILGTLLDPALTTLADEAIEAALAIKPNESHKDLLERIDASQDAVDKFIDACRESVALE